MTCATCTAAYLREEHLASTGMRGQASQKHGRSDGTAAEQARQRGVAAHLGVKGNPSNPVSVALPTHDQVPLWQMPHLPCLVITARHLGPESKSPVLHFCLPGM